MTSIDVPSWVSLVRGPAPLVLVAPHGGRRHELRHPGKHKVNDLWTAELTRELAGASGASAVINASRDRNEVDLNRLSQVRRDAQWFLALLADLLTTLVADAGHATVLVIHGWNVTQSACDVGVGLCEGPDGLVPARPDAGTVSAEFIAARLRSLQSAADAAGIAVTIGSRYPAAHPNNLLQAFRLTGDADGLDRPSARLAALCRSGRVDAAQLELAIPLRWPGPRRDRFLALLADTFGTPIPQPASRGRPASLAVRTGRVTGRRGLTLVDGELMVMASIDAGESGALGGRLLVSTTDGRLALFTGELSEMARPWSIPPLFLGERDRGGFELRYDGPLVEFPLLTPFLDLERGLSAGTLVEAQVSLVFHPDAAPHGGDDESFGDVRGEVAIGGIRHVVATRGVLTAAERLSFPRLPSLRLTVPKSPWGSLACTPDPEQPFVDVEPGRLAGSLLVRAAQAGVRRAACDLRWSRAAGTIELLFASDGDRAEQLTGRLERLVPVRRPGRDGAVIEGTYALVRFATGDVGWAEIAVVARSADTVGSSAEEPISEG